MFSIDAISRFEQFIRTVEGQWYIQSKSCAVMGLGCDSSVVYYLKKGGVTVPLLNWRMRGEKIANI